MELRTALAVILDIADKVFASFAGNVLGAWLVDYAQIADPRTKAKIFELVVERVRQVRKQETGAAKTVSTFRYKQVVLI